MGPSCPWCGAAILIASAAFCGSCRKPLGAAPMGPPPGGLPPGFGPPLGAPPPGMAPLPPLPPAPGVIPLPPPMPAPMPLPVAPAPTPSNVQAPNLPAWASDMFAKLRHPRRGHALVVGACHKDPPDQRDRQYLRHHEHHKDALPAAIDLRAWLTPVEDQGALGSCVANAIAGAYEYLQKRLTGGHGDMSRLFLYYQMRKLGGTVDQDSGAFLRDGIKTLQHDGVCSEPTWPYRLDAWAKEPPRAAYEEAARHTIDWYQRIPADLHAMKVSLMLGYPFVFGVKIFATFQEDGEDGRVTMPSKRERNLGGHAMLAVGYSDREGGFLVRNSWGTDWGDGGYCWMPYDYLADGELMHDAWALGAAHDLDFAAGGSGGDVGSAEDYHDRR